MSAVDLYRKSRAALIRKIGQLQNQQSTIEEEQQEEAERSAHFRSLVGRGVGSLVTGPATAGVVGYLETRFPSKDGSRMSLGPVPLSALAGIGAAAASVVPWVGAHQMSYVAAANFGLAMGTLARGYGAADRAKSIADKKRAAKAALAQLDKEPKVAGVFDDGYGHIELTDGYDYDEEDSTYDGHYDGHYDAGHDGDSSYVGALPEDEWTPQERELLGV